MPKNDLGNIRRSQTITTYGPGAIIDFRAGGHGGGPVSVVAAGLEQWDQYAPPAGLLNAQTISEPRLEKQLHVAGFRLPPVNPEGIEHYRHGSGHASADGRLLGVRFPRWLQCPVCHDLKLSGKWAADPGDPALYCGPCSAADPAQRRIHVVPSRFVTACANGHLDDFPWEWWVGHKSSCTHDRALKLESDGRAGLAGLVVSCPACGSSRPMEGVFSKGALKALRCAGKRPWLGVDEQDCDAEVRGLQRGASNLYFPVIFSSLDIPPWSDPLQKRLGILWPVILSAESDADMAVLIRLHKLTDRTGLTQDELLAEIRARKEALNKFDPGRIRVEEHQHFIRGSAADRAEGGEENEYTEFEIRHESVPASLGSYIPTLCRAVRLREVRALSAFTRIQPPPGQQESGTVRFSAIKSEAANVDWLPAIEVRGEGIFVELAKDRLLHWERHPDVVARVAPVRQAFEKDWVGRYGKDGPAPRDISPRLILLHTLAHVLIRQLSLECGYSSASLRERIFASTDTDNMAGLLIYTATSDADGTLGGLARQGAATRFESTLIDGIKSISWCSSDPLCIYGISSLSETYNLAACHCCTLVSETSCEEFNRLLDRGLLIGTPENPAIGFFSALGVS